MTFKRWLSLQRDRTDGVGILATAVRYNPPQIVRWSQSDLLRHLSGTLPQVHPMWNACYDALDEFRASERARKAAK